MERWILYAIISMLFAGFTSVIAKFGLKNVSGDTGLAVRTVFVFLFVWTTVLLFQPLKEFTKLTIKDVGFLAISAFTTTVSWIFYYRAMKEGEVSMVASIDKASIVVTILLSFLLLKEPVTAKLLTGAGFILVGLMILVWK
ncbi:MAG TPA: EamA family transporter [Cytophagaceae bacterium]|jgi:transporter family protein|nr:EamA family transporter [Cytophagaceae bacterium]